MKICQHCQLDFDNKYQFCDKCGGKLKEKIDKLFCPYCGNKIETEGEFCPYCGNAFTYEEPKPMTSSITDSKDFKLVTTTSKSKVESASMQNHDQKQVIQKPLPKKNKENIKTPGAEETDSTFKSAFKLILYGIGGIVLFFLIKVIGQGIGKAAVSNGYGLHLFILCLVLVPFYFYYNNKN